MYEFSCRFLSSSTCMLLVLLAQLLLFLLNFQSPLHLLPAFHTQSLCFYHFRFYKYISRRCCLFTFPLFSLACAFLTLLAVWICSELHTEEVLYFNRRRETGLKSLFFGFELKYEYLSQLISTRKFESKMSANGDALARWNRFSWERRVLELNLTRIKFKPKMSCSYDVADDDDDETTMISFALNKLLLPAWVLIEI